ncbi:MAG: hypothetical protein ACLFQ8_01820 [Candidatus Aenigmatarchaeota archaeon]
MDHEIIKEAIERIRGLPTFSRIRDELREKFALKIDEKELKEDLEEMMRQEKIKEKETTIKGTRFKGYTVVREEKQEEEEEKSKEEEVIDEVFG